MKKCGRCLACSYIKEGNSIRGRSYNGENIKWNIEKPLSCTSANIVYMIECQKDYCKKRYIGITQRELKERMFEHIGYVRNKVKSKSTGEHFNLPGHSTSDMKFTAIEKVKTLDALYGREREKYHIRKFNTFYN
jgi:hypothetical protein